MKSLLLPILLLGLVSAINLKAPPLRLKNLLQIKSETQTEDYVDDLLASIVAAGNCGNLAAPPVPVPVVCPPTNTTTPPTTPPVTPPTPPTNCTPPNNTTPNPPTPPPKTPPITPPTGKPCDNTPDAFVNNVLL